MNNVNEQHGIFRSSLGPSQILVAGFLMVILVKVDKLQALLMLYLLLLQQFV